MAKPRLSEMHVVPREEVVAQPKETKEFTATMVEQLTRATSLRDALQYWQRLGEKELRKLVRGADENSKRTWESRMPPDEVERRAKELSEAVGNATRELDGLAAGLFTSEALQQVYIDAFGTEIHSLDDAEAEAGRLLRPFYDQYIRHRDEHKRDGVGTHDYLTAEQAAWDVTARAVPSGIDIMDSDQLGDMHGQREAFDELVRKLSLLPGPHHDAAHAFLSQQGDAHAAHRLLHSYTAYAPVSKRFDRIELDRSWLPAHLDELEQMLEQARTLVTIAKEQFADLDICLPQEAEALYREMQELFGEKGFLGIEVVERAFTLQNGEKLVDLTAEERTEVRRLLKKKLAEPDVAQFVAKLQSGEIKAEEWMLILRVPTITVRPVLQGIDAFGEAFDSAVRDGRVTATAEKQHIPLTMKTMKQYLEPAMKERREGRLLSFDLVFDTAQPFYALQQPGNTDTRSEDIAASRGAGAMHWQFVTRAVLPDVYSKATGVQQHVLRKRAQSYGLDPDKVRKRVPVEMVYDHNARFRGVGEPTMCHKPVYDQSDVCTPSGDRVYVGNYEQHGLYVGKETYPDKRPREYFGMSLSR